MNTHKILTLALCATMAFASNANAQAKKKKTDKTTANTEVNTQTKTVDTELCNENMSLFYEAAKAKNYADAIAPWTEVYNDCPQLSKTIYTYGARILDWQINKETDPAKKVMLIEKLMKMFDDQMKYFGNDDKTPADAVLAIKARYALQYNPDATENPYNWLKESVNKLDLASDYAAIQSLVGTSYKRYQAQQIDVETFINDYLNAARICDANAKNPELKTAANYAETKQNLDHLFVHSGAADCEQLEKIYADKIDAHKTDQDYLNNVIRFFKRLKCTESPVFFAASRYAHQIAPTYESANGLAAMYYKDKDYAKAVASFEEAIKLADNNEDKADAYLKMATIYKNNLHNLGKARECAQASLDIVPTQGEPYILIAMCYAETTASEDPILNRARYWVAVDILQKAKSVDASVADAANKLIYTYSANFPKKDEIFMHPDLNLGSTYSVFGRTTTVRARN